MRSRPPGTRPACSMPALCTAPAGGQGAAQEHHGPADAPRPDLGRHGGALLAAQASACVCVCVRGCVTRACAGRQRAEAVVSRRSPHQLRLRLQLALLCVTAQHDAANLGAAQGARRLCGALASPLHTLSLYIPCPQLTCTTKLTCPKLTCPRKLTCTTELGVTQGARRRCGALASRPRYMLATAVSDKTF